MTDKSRVASATAKIVTQRLKTIEKTIEKSMEVFTIERTIESDYLVIRVISIIRVIGVNCN